MWKARIVTARRTRAVQKAARSLCCPGYWLGVVKLYDGCLPIAWSPRCGAGLWLLRRATGSRGQPQEPEGHKPRRSGRSAVLMIGCVCGTSEDMERVKAAGEGLIHPDSDPPLENFADHQFLSVDSPEAGLYLCSHNSSPLA